MLCRRMEGTRACYAKGNKPGSERQILYFLLCVGSVSGGPDMDVEGLLGGGNEKAQGQVNTTNMVKGHHVLV